MRERFVYYNYSFPVQFGNVVEDMANRTIHFHLLCKKTLCLFQIHLNQEHRLMLAFAPDYDRLPLIAKVEVFEHALQNTEGNDLAKVYHLC